MRLALVISSLSYGGAERVLSSLANHWAKENHQVSIITWSPEGTEAFYPLDPKISLIQLNQIESRTSLLPRLISIFKRVFCLRKAIKNLDPNLVISFIDVTNIAAIMATIGLNVPIIVSERIDPALHKLPGLYERLRLVVYPFCKRIIVQTEKSASYFPTDFTKILDIIPNSVVISQKYAGKARISRNVNKIIAVGRLSQQKNHTILIRAFAALSERYNLKLTIYGEGNDRVRLEQLITSLNLQEKVFLPGVVSDVYSALEGADLFVFPSLYEGFPNALCEAMAMGLPVIASDCSGNIDVVRDGVDGRLFHVGDTKGLINIMTELLDDFDQRKRLSENAKEICNRFHPDRIFAMWDQVINDVSCK